MSNLNINFVHNTIEMPKAFAKAAGKYGSEEYQALQCARKDYPTYSVVIIKRSGKKRDSFKGLTYEYMEQYMS